MKKKQIISLIVMAVLVAALAVGYVFAKQMNDNKKKAKEEEEAAEQAQVIDMYDLNVEEVESIVIENDMTSFEMIRDGDFWIQKEQGVPLNSEDTQYMLNSIANIDAIRVIEEDASELSQYGLEKPALTYTIKMMDGTEYTLKFGIKLQTQLDAYYAILDDTNTVYSVAENYYDPYYVSLEELTSIEDEVYINADNITSVAVKTADGLDFSASALGNDFEGSEYYRWKIDEPYAGVLVDTDRLKEVITAISGMAYQSCVAYGCEDMAKYGLEKPFAEVSVEYYDEVDGKKNYSTYGFNVGDRYTDGSAEGFYVNPVGSTNVYKVNAVPIETVTGFTAFSIADHCIYTILVDQLSGYDIEYEDVKISVERKTEGEEDVYYVNGKKVETEDLLRLYSAAYLLECTGEADKEKATPDETPVLTLTYHRSNGQDDVIKYIPYDGNNFYQVDNNGVNYFLTNKRGIDDLIRRYKEYMNKL